MCRPKTVRLRYVDEVATARAALLWDQAPLTCAAVMGLLPTHGMAHHGIYSGSECVYLLPEVLRLDKEHATSDVRQGQVGFTWMAGGSSFGVRDDFAEVCWFYDLDAQPRMWEGPVEVNIFAEIIEPADEFYAICYRMRREGTKRFAIEADDSPETDD